MMTLWEHIDALRIAYEKFTSSVCKKHNLKPREFDVLLYLHYHPDEATATDIVRKQNLSKSHVSVSLRALEERGLVVGEFRGSNRRTIYLSTTEKAKDIIADGTSTIELFARTMLTGFSEAEMTTFFDLLSRVKKNVMSYAKAR